MKPIDLIYLACSAFVGYSMIAFIQADWNISHWSYEIRAGSAAGWIFGILLGFILQRCKDR